MIIRFNYRQLLALTCVLVAVLATSAPAMGKGSSSSVTAHQYGDRAGELNAAAADPGSDPGLGSSGSLPFTGLDLGLMATAAGVLLVGGVAIRRRSRAEADV